MSDTVERMSGAVRRMSEARRRLAAGVCAIACALGGSATSLHAMETATPLWAVDTRIGTANDGNTYPGATVPFGMVQWSPDTKESFYHYGDRQIRGFSLTHLSGAGCPLFADMPILPWSERPAATRDVEHPETVGFSHAGEIAQPGYYAVTLADGSRVELTASDRAGMARITYPAGHKAGLLVNGAGSASADVHMATLPPVGREQDGESLRVMPDGSIVGTTTAGGFCGSATHYTLHVVYRFKQKPGAVALWKDGVAVPDGTQASGRRAAAWLDLGAGREQVVKVGLSYVSESNARANLDAEMPDWSFDEARRRAERRWTDALARIEIAGASDAERRIFYTGLYHMLTGQTLFSDANGEYMGFDSKPHQLRAGQRGQYTNISDWDIYRNTVQMQALLFPQEASDLAQSLVNDAEQFGSFPRWTTANGSSYVMGGDSPPLLLASIYAFGARDFDTAGALRWMRHAALDAPEGARRSERDDAADMLKLGYIPSAKSDISASETLEINNADFATAQFAGALGDRSTQKLLLARAANWRKLMDPETHWIRPRNADGTWVAGFDAERSLPKRANAPVSTDQLGFEEGNTYQYTFMLPFDYAGLFDAMGDRALVERRLDRFFEKLVCWGEPCFNMANEPDFVTPYAYTALGEPWKTADVLTRIENETFNTSPGGIPGNDDLGATSGVYVWNALGMYPMIPGLGGVALGTPRFSKAVLHLGAGGVLEITRQGEGRYVRDVQVNGVEHTSSWLDLSGHLREPLHLEFTMQANPSAWATASSDRPPSMSGMSGSVQRR